MSLFTHSPHSRTRGAWKQGRHRNDSAVLWQLFCLSFVSDKCCWTAGCGLAINAGDFGPTVSRQVGICVDFSDDNKFIKLALGGKNVARKQCWHLQKWLEKWLVLSPWPKKSISFSSASPPIGRNAFSIYIHTYMEHVGANNVAIFIFCLVLPLFPLTVVMMLARCKRHYWYSGWIEGRLQDIFFMEGGDRRLDFETSSLWFKLCTSSLRHFLRFYF